MTRWGKHSDTLVSVAIGVLLALSVIALHVAAKEDRPLPPQRQEAQADDEISFKAFVLDVSRDSLVVEVNEELYETVPGNAKEQIHILTNASTTIEHRGEPIIPRQILPTSLIHVSGTVTTDRKILAEKIIVVMQAEPRDVEMLSAVPESAILEIEELPLDSGTTSSSSAPVISPEEENEIIATTTEDGVMEVPDVISPSTSSSTPELDPSAAEEESVSEPITHEGS